MLVQIKLGEIPARHPVAVFYGFWLGAAGGGTAPWDRFDAAEHPKLLPWILLLKRELETAPGEPAWRYAVCGTGCTELFGFSYQGKLFGEALPAAAAAERREEFRQVANGSGPLLSRTHLPIPDRETVPIYRGVFPFTGVQGEVDRIVVVLARAALNIA